MPEEAWEVPGKYSVSPYNYTEDVVSEYEFKEPVPIYDFTLAKLDVLQGSLSPHHVSVEDKVEIAGLLDEIGITGMVFNPTLFNEGPRSQSQHDTFDAIASEGFKFKVIAIINFGVWWDRDYKEDVDWLIDAGAAEIHVHVPPFWQAGILPGWSIDRLKNGPLPVVDYVKSRSVESGITVTDITRADLDKVIPMANHWLDNGIDSLVAADSYGTLSPQAVTWYFRRLQREMVRRVPILYHCHDTFGMATAQMISAATVGVDPMVTVNGIGDRAGTADLAEVVVSLELLYGAKTGIKFERLTELSNLVERITGIVQPVQRPILGVGLHVPPTPKVYQDIFKGATYQQDPIKPALVGQKTWPFWWEGMLVPATVKAKLEQMGLRYEDRHVVEIEQAARDRLKRIDQYPAWLPDEEVAEICKAIAGSIRGLAARD